MLERIIHADVLSVGVKLYTENIMIVFLINISPTCIHDCGVS